MSVLKLAVDQPYYAPGQLLNLVVSLHNTELLLATRLVVSLVVSAELSNECKSQGANAGAGAGAEGYALPHGLQANLADASRLQTLVLWSSINKSGRALHPKPRSFAAQLVVPCDAAPSVLLTAAGYDRAHISYTLRAELITTSAFPSLRATTDIPIVSTVSRLRFQSATLPAMCAKAFTHFAVDMAVSCDQSVYSIGSPIALNFTVANADRRDIKGIKVSLIQRCNTFFIPDLGTTYILASEALLVSIAPGKNKSLAVLLSPEKACQIAPTTSYSFVQVEHFVCIQVIPSGLFVSSTPIVFEIPVILVGSQRS
ncbi:hypothetical protein BSLG_001144 [Batrachochytrium salamandrivorans]|nr:hypothetical protein BSLG_001144 [Batrachochytrium salamandrivorans]